MNKYADKEEFLNLIKTYRETNDPKAYRSLAKIFLKIANNLTYHYWYVNYSKDRKDEMVSDAVYYMIKYMGSFDVERGNPFAYFTTTAWRAFRQYIMKTKRREEIFTSIEYIDNMNESE